MEHRTLREEADIIVRESVRRVLPDQAVVRALEGRDFGSGRLYVVAVGKAAWQMARTAAEILSGRIQAGICITKYGHVKGEINPIACFEAGHPIPDENAFRATEKALELVSDLHPEDTVLFLLSGGGSALFEKPLVTGEELMDVTNQMLACGANIVEMNTVRKRLSQVKGGRFAERCYPAKVLGIILSDILGDPLDMIGSGPICADTSTCQQALEIVEKYGLHLSRDAMELLGRETPKILGNVETMITGSVKDLCRAAADTCRGLGYEPYVLTDRLDCEAREAGSFLAAIAKSHQESKNSLAYIVGGETVVHLTGKGKGGRNQELALSAGEGIDGLQDTAVFSVGSDGTDGPTDAAGGYCDDKTKGVLEKMGVDIYRTLGENNSYEALRKAGGLIFTGATGTNVNDVAVLLIRRHKRMDGI